MKICIYCKTQEQSLFKGVEHLIPQCFGKFSSKTPTLKCVCDECNAYFAKELDQALARDSWEGVNRYKKGISSREQRPTKRLRFSLEKVPEVGVFGGMVFEGVDSKTGKLLKPRGQFQIKNRITGEFDNFFIDEIKDIQLDDNIYGTRNNRETKIFAPSKKEHQDVIDELKKIGINYKVKEEKIGLPLTEGRKGHEIIEIPIWIEGKIDNIIKRALIKILLNFSTFYIGENEILRSEWDKARNYVRNDSTPILGKIDSKPFWSEETETMRFASDSINIIVENEGENVVGKIQIYNFYTYTFILVERHNIPQEKETAVRFTKGYPPFTVGKK